MILLTGILLAIAFTLFSLQLALVANLGQQAGRETRNPVLDDYLALRAELATALENELRNETGDSPCPTDVDQFGRKVDSFLTMLTSTQRARGHHFTGSLMSITLDASDPTDKFLRIRVSMVVTDGITSVQDTPTYFIACD